MLRSLLITLTLLAVLGGLLAACAPNPAAPTNLPWRYADVRRLDDVDSDLPAECDMIAAYLRWTEDELQLRLDFLAPFSHRCGLWVAINGQPGGRPILPDGSDAGMAWDILLSYASESKPVAWLASGDSAPFIPRVIVDPDSASIVIHINHHRMPFKKDALQFSAFSSQNDQSVDSISTISLNESPPPRAPMLWVFSSVLQPDTAQTARAGWDAAHSGPAGSRFGLRHLMQAALDARVPITLLDVRRPSILSALEALGGLDYLTRMQNAGLLLAPDYVSSAAGSPDASRQLNRQIGQSLGMPPSLFVYGSLACKEIRAGSIYFASLPDTAHLTSTGSTRLIPLPDPPAAMLDARGITPNALHRLVSAAMSADPTDLVVFHETLPASFAGDARIIARAMAYLAAHPWIQPLSSTDLQTWPARSLAQFPCPALLCASAAPDFPSPITAGLPSNSAADWARILADDPPSTFLNPSARNMQIAGLVLAAHWLANPQPFAACGLDVDQNQREDCLLASDQVLLAVSIANASPAILAMRNHAPDDLILSFSPLSDLNPPPSVEITSTHLILQSADGSIHSRWSIRSSPPELILEPPAGGLNLTFTVPGMQRYTSQWAQRYSPRKIPGGWQVGALSITVSSSDAALECAYSPVTRLRQPQDPERAEPSSFSLPLDSCQLHIPGGSSAVFSLSD